MTSTPNTHFTDTPIYCYNRGLLVSPTDSYLAFFFFFNIFSYSVLTLLQLGGVLE